MEDDFKTIVKNMELIILKDRWTLIRVKKVIAIARKWLLPEGHLDIDTCIKLKTSTPLRITSSRTLNDIYFSLTYKGISIEFGKDKLCK